VVRVKGDLNWMIAAWDIVGQKSLRGTNPIIHD